MGLFDREEEEENGNAIECVSIDTSMRKHQESTAIESMIFFLDFIYIKLLLSLHPILDQNSSSMRYLWIEG